MAEMLDKNRQEVKKWLADDKDAINWDDFIEHYVYMDAKSYKTDPTGADDIEARKVLMRSKMKDVIACDVVFSNPIDPIEATFDVVGSSLMVEAAAGSTYKQLLKNASNLVKPGGFFIQFVCGPNCSDWRCGSSFFTVIESQTLEDNIASLDEAGFDTLETSCIKLPPYPDGKFDGTEMYLMVCKKRK
ncbi:unnamed protein product [Owenia fusiformis]|uniref:Uncharacterized protein n=1 Tax=Owenia fusiformis TaxID=6347 RepID=A0A8J1UFB7_OWEFU|nr:unnamed protein product [Owenia fusiformis]